MDVRAYIKRESAGGNKVRQIVFEGERFDATSSSILHALADRGETKILVKY